MATATDDDVDNLALRILRGTIWGTVDLIRNACIETRFHAGVLITRSRMAVKRYREARRFADGVEPDPDEIPGRRWAFARYTCLECKRSWKTFKALNYHLVHAHPERPERDPDVRAGARMFTGRPHGKAMKKIKRDRPPTAAPAKRTIWNGVNRTVNSDIGQRLKAAWTAFGELRPRGLSEIHHTLMDMEQLHGAHVPKMLEEYRVTLVRMGFDPALMQNLTRAADEISAAAGRFSATVGVIEEALATEIAAAKAAKNGSKPSAEVLAN